MVEILGRVNGAANKLAYRVLVNAYTFEITVAGKALRIRNLPNPNGSKLPVSHLNTAFNEVRRFLEARGATLVAGFVPFMFN